MVAITPNDSRAFTSVFNDSQQAAYTMAAESLNRLDRQEDSEWDSDSNESVPAPSQGAEGASPPRDDLGHAASGVLTPGAGRSGNLDSSSDSPEYELRFVDNTENAFSLSLQDDESSPITITCTGSWAYTFIFALSWILAPFLIVLSKIRGGQPVGLKVPRIFRRRR
jgi:hypothetical protein